MRLVDVLGRHLHEDLHRTGHAARDAAPARASRNGSFTHSTYQSASSLHRKSYRARAATANSKPSSAPVTVLSRRAYLERIHRSANDFSTSSGSANTTPSRF